ncbi:UDP-N-acetylmuramate--L-alanine ligase [Bifidobacterium choloepi]|uniref:UDP-N-acetylmuramate--L-alanine ligase n=1 Tax=Bifidobacterium choloepi TaxID=2614131 RepID=A0A6I5N885_9BIFI|nr:Mur ligase domain-containing protein [Bifidobacterium choloepi]NEG70051.1 UDP-N-acetylmuramate--L-alanine ligase [Bifidobacterium choloepi]
MSAQIVLDPTAKGFGDDETVESLGRVHFIGIGGAGMSVLAEMLHEQGVAVQGSDREANAKTGKLESLGIPVFIGQQAGNVAGADTVVFSSAIKPDNPEIVAAADAGARIVHRSDILALLMNGRKAVTVAGAHGKTTTSSMLAHILTNGAADGTPLADPSYAIGASIQGPDGAILDGGHAGSGDVLVAEADESDGSFEKYRPEIAIVTNTEPDHLDHYGDAEHYRDAFVEHAGHARRAVIVSYDDEGAREVLAGLPADVLSRTIVTTTDPSLLDGNDSSGAAPSAAHADTGATVTVNGVAVPAVVIESEREATGSGAESFTLALPAAVAGEPVRQPVTLDVPGIHNARNAAAAIVAAVMLGMAPADAARAVGSFLGAARRFQVRGTVGGVTVVDDYAHHPTEIAALLTAARRRYPQATIHVLFQPHLFSRTKFFAGEFAEALAIADDVIVTDVYPAREKAVDFPGVGAETIVDAALELREDGDNVAESADADAETVLEAVIGDDVVAEQVVSEPASPAPRRDDWICVHGDMATAAQMMALRADPGDVVFTVGAGDITSMGPVLLHALEARFAGQDQ